VRAVLSRAGGGRRASENVPIGDIEIDFRDAIRRTARDSGFGTSPPAN